MIAFFITATIGYLVIGCALAWIKGKIIRRRLDAANQARTVDDLAARYLEEYRNGSWQR